jgi:hypothetical protein
MYKPSSYRHLKRFSCTALYRERERARLTATFSCANYHDVLVVALDNRGRRGVVVCPLLHILIVEGTSNYTSDDGAAPVGGLTDRVRLVRLSEDAARTPISAIDYDRNSSPVRVGDVGASIYIVSARLFRLDYTSRQARPQNNTNRLEEGTLVRGRADSGRGQDKR